MTSIDAPFVASYIRPHIDSSRYLPRVRGFRGFKMGLEKVQKIADGPFVNTLPPGRVLKNKSVIAYCVFNFGMNVILIDSFVLGAPYRLALLPWPQSESRDIVS